MGLVKSEVSILAVDDDTFIIKLLQQALKRLGFSRFAASGDGEQALALMARASSAPDLIILDLSMPRMDGVEFIRKLTEQDYRGQLILISGVDERALRSAEKLVLAHGLNLLGRLQKPIVPKELALLLVKLMKASTEFQPRPAGIKRYSGARLEQALAQGELVNVYQPIVDLRTGALLKFEVLARWQHPEDGLVMPDTFVPDLEDSYLIDALAYDVLTRALDAAAQWREADLRVALAVNLSMQNLVTIELPDRFEQAVLERGFLPKDVTLEVTETRPMTEPARVLDTLTRLRLKRFPLAIDDFGTGHASLAQLRDIPFDQFKLDRSFVHRGWFERDVKAMFDTSLSLAKQMDMVVVAEGVEHREDWDFVRASPCDWAQGYFIAKPMLAEEVVAWADSWHQRVRRELMPPELESPGASKAPGGAKATVLVVEDNDFQRKVQSRILRDEGYHAVTAGNGREALQLLRSLRPHVILMDLDMPEVSGLEVLRRLRGTSAFRHTPVVIVSGANVKNAVEDCMAAGASSFMLKPFDRKTLVARVEKALATTPTKN
ncbi:EAL domain-containing protein [Marinimicrobium alkaliphilum]|uniref:EAL domain-containing protein n=1 Tax=Marinimicrobium alkaliphilum TaxID=2202654 RepID=UPI001E2FF8BD|nr:EAL domain-containing protein [Marinimicrobium alkaliphilum]